MGVRGLNVYELTSQFLLRNHSGLRQIKPALRAASRPPFAKSAKRSTQGPGCPGNSEDGAPDPSLFHGLVILSFGICGHSYLSGPGLVRGFISEKQRLKRPEISRRTTWDMRSSGGSSLVCS